MLNRRSIIIGACVSLRDSSVGADPYDHIFDANTNKILAEKWINFLIENKKTPFGSLNLGRFADPMYYTIRPIEWAPSITAESPYPPVSVPSGFVTDLASIPRIFWSALRPDGLYAYAAIVHDYLYWKQPYEKAVADGILDQCMKDFGVEGTTRAAIYNAVRLFGAQSWAANKTARSSGERRSLVQFPTDPRVTWTEWKRDLQHFTADE